MVTHSMSPYTFCISENRKSTLYFIYHPHTIETCHVRHKLIKTLFEEKEKDQDVIRILSVMMTLIKDQHEIFKMFEYIQTLGGVTKVLYIVEAKSNFV